MHNKKTEVIFMADEINISPDNNRLDNDVKTEGNSAAGPGDDINMADDANNADINDGNVNNNEVRQDTGINNFTMDNAGNIRTTSEGAAAITGSSRIFLGLGWVCAALTVVIYPLFAIPGIIFGVLANRQLRDRGTMVIIANIVLAAVYFILAECLRAMGWWR